MYLSFAHNLLFYFSFYMVANSILLLLTFYFSHFPLWFSFLNLILWILYGCSSSLSWLRVIKRLSDVYITIGIVLFTLLYLEKLVLKIKLEFKILDCQGLQYLLFMNIRELTWSQNLVKDELSHTHSSWSWMFHMWTGALGPQI